MPSRTRPLALACVLLVAGAGCPSEVDPSAAKPASAQAPMVDESDPRVVRDGEDLYAAQTMERAEALDRKPDDDTPGLGSGRPDETNGLCRLYAPRLPRPQCCNAEFGFDLETVQKACGVETYLGESFQGSCGYYFHQEGEEPTRSYFRMSFVAGADPKAVADAHDRKLVERNPGFQSTPIPGIDGAYWSGLEGVNWAFLPGWTKVRQLTWRDSICSREKIIPVIRQLIAAKEPPKGAPRSTLVPTARK